MRSKVVAILSPLVAVAMFTASPLLAGQSGPAIGSVAPPLNGSAWVTSDGKAPDLRGKVLLVYFWFVR
ncbi:MAG TPA: hypothetical protein VGP72_18495 [Planctomycetota bacterium]|jgi:hypothetical protein